jgi:Zn-finger protein
VEFAYRLECSAFCSRVTSEFSVTEWREWRCPLLHWLNRQTKEIKDQDGPEFWDCISDNVAELSLQYGEITDRIQQVIDKRALEHCM